MADLTHGTKWSDTILLEKESSTVNIPVGGTYSDKDIELTVTIPESTAKNIVGTGSVSVYSGMSDSLIVGGITPYYFSPYANTTAGYINAGTVYPIVFNNDYFEGIVLQEDTFLSKGFTISTDIGDFLWRKDSNGNIWVE